MISYLTSVTKPVWADAEHTQIDCWITTTQFGDEKIPFTACPNDVEEHGRNIYADLVAGKYGPIGEYVAPPIEPTPPSGAIPVTEA